MIIQGRCRDRAFRIKDQSFPDKATDVIGGLTPVAGSQLNRAWLGKTFTPPFQTAANCPTQNARPFRLELIGQIRIALVFRYL